MTKAEIKNIKRNEYKLYNLEERREKVNSLRNSRGELSFVVEDIFAELMEKFSS